MGIVLQKRLKQKKFRDVHQEALLNLIVTAGYLGGMLERACSEYGISQQQYNILRILRGVNPGGHSCGELAGRMLHPSPDITRRLDALEREGYVARARSTHDRRVVHSIITEKGLTLLLQMEHSISMVDHLLHKKLTAQDCKELSRICEKIYGENPQE